MSLTKVRQTLITPITATGSTVARSLQDRFADVVNVLDFGADPTGITDSVQSIRNAIDFAKSKGGGVILFPAGNYKLTLTSTYLTMQCHFPIEDADFIDFVGYGAELNSTASPASLFYLNGCRRINFEGFDIVGTFSRTLNVVNTYSISCFDINSTTRDSEQISIKNCRTQNTYLFIRVLTSNNSYRVRNILVENVFCYNGYYGINFQENGDNVTVINLRTMYFIRSYFPYGVTNHNINYTSFGGDVFTDCLIKAYANDTTNINVKAVIIGNTSTDAHVAIETQHNPTTQPVPAKLKNININIDDSQCASGSSSLRIGYWQDTPNPTVTSTSSYQLFDNIKVRGNFRSLINYAVTQSTGSGVPKGLIDTSELNYTPTANPTQFGFYNKFNDYAGANASADFIVGYPNNAVYATAIKGSINFYDATGTTAQGYYDGGVGLSKFKFYGINPFLFETNATTAGQITHEFDGTGIGYGVKLYEGNNNGTPNAANAVVKIGQMNISGRSVNAAGTLNASGADYAEYEDNNGLIIEKGDIVGFKADGKLTLTFDEAIRFGVKSTNPSFVGGDIWGSDSVPPEKPVRIIEQKEVVKVSDEIYEGDVCIQPSKYEEVIKVKGDTDEEWDKKEKDYKDAVAEFEANLENKRKFVDRIAYSGKVPVNVIGATSGGYIIADKDESGNIIGKFVMSPSFEEYKLSIGRVNKILEDGRAEVAIIIH